MGFRGFPRPHTRGVFLPNSAATGAPLSGYPPNSGGVYRTYWVPTENARAPDVGITIRNRTPLMARLGDNKIRANQMQFCTDSKIIVIGMVAYRTQSIIQILPIEPLMRL